MATIYRFRVGLTGFIGGPGLNTWYMAQVGAAGGADEGDLEAIAADIRAVYDAAKTYLASGVSAQVDAVVEGIDVTTGNLVSVTGITPPAAVAGTSAASLSRATQICVRLKTDAIKGNRLIQGRHFFGPVATNAVATDGQIASAARTALTTAYGGVLDLAGNARLVVYSKKGKDKEGNPTVGEFGYVQQVLPNSTPGTLRSRKV